MNVIRHGQHLVQIEQQFPFSVNVYFVLEQGGLTLIDAGLPGAAKVILKTARDLALPVRRIVLTHAHADHVGALPALRRALPNAQLLVPAGEILPEKLGVQPDGLLSGEGRVGPLRVLASPGHTLGHVAFLDERDGSLIAGDALLTAGGVHVSGVRRLRAPISFLLSTADQALALRSAALLRDLRPSRLAVGHGPVLERPGVAMTRAIQEAERHFHPLADATAR